MANKKPLVSILIPTYNSEKTLSRCLQSIGNQTYSNIEVIIVDKHSEDKTTQIARQFNCKVHVVEALERSDQFNHGVEVAQGEYIYRVDSDFILEPTITEEAVNKILEYGYDAICVHNTPDPTISFWSRIRKFEKDMYKEDDLNVAARFIRKDVFQQVGGFNADLVAGEDYDLHNRLLAEGYKIGMIEAEEIHIGEPRSIKEIIDKHYYYGKTIGKFLKNNPQRGVRQMNPLRPAYIKNWKKFLENPHLTFFFIIYQIIRYSSAILGYLAYKVSL